MPIVGVSGTAYSVLFLAFYAYWREVSGARCQVLGVRLGILWAADDAFRIFAESGVIFLINFYLGFVEASFFCSSTTSKEGDATHADPDGT
jgi:hypothetical protein